MPEWVVMPLRRIRNIMREIIYYGNSRLCPVCGNKSRKFLEFGLTPRKEAQCVYCGVLERHRFFWLFLSKKTDLFNGQPKKMLHVAPEPYFESKFRDRLGDNYITADLYNPLAMVKMDITNIEFEDESFDVIYCSHVLEHVQDDRGAMREFFRVLKPHGWAILLVPIKGEKTFEDSSIVDPLERLKKFGKEDHVRQYGLDYVDRLRDVGFTVEVTEVEDLVQEDEAIRMGLTSDSGEIFYCTK